MPHEYSKTELDNMTLKDLKLLGSRYQIPRYSTFKVINKHELANLIWQKFIDLTPSVKLTPSKKLDSMPPPLYKTPLRTPKNQTPLGTPKNEMPPPPNRTPKNPFAVGGSGTPKTNPFDSPSPRVPSKSSNSSKDSKIKVEKIDFNLIDKDIIKTLTVNVEKLPTYSSEDDIIRADDPDDITPEILLGLIKDDNFCRQIATSLRDIYKAKEDKYRKLEQKVQKSIESDKAEKNQMAFNVDGQTLEKLYPFIGTNSALLIKLQTLRRKSNEKHKEFISLNNELINDVREKFKLAITDSEDGIMSITGDSRKLIRNQICKQLFILSKGYRPFMDAFINMVFTGPAGVGKTKLAKTYGFVFQNSGILLQGELIIVSPRDMIGEFVGQTANKTAGMLMKGLESVIFLDEAYQLMPCNSDGELTEGSNSFGPEAITEIVNFLDKNIGMSIMIVAGYQKQMDGCFFAANEGLRRRFPISVKIPKYSNIDLLNIFLNETNERIGKNIYDKEIAKYIYTIIVNLDSEQPLIFINQAGDMMNLSSMFLETYYSGRLYNWGTKENNQKIIIKTFNIFLQNKGYKMTIK